MQKCPFFNNSLIQHKQLCSVILWFLFVPLPSIDVVGVDVESNFGTAVYDTYSHILHWYTEGLPQTGNSTIIKVKVHFDHGSASDGTHYITTGTHVRAVLNGADGAEVVREGWGGNGPALRKQKYTVSWDMNVDEIECGSYPEGESGSNRTNDPKTHKPYAPSETRQDPWDMVQMPQNVPVCRGWNFKGWRNTDTDETRVNEDNFEMPHTNVTFRATWGRPTVSKSTTGQVYEDRDDFLIAGGNNSYMLGNTVISKSNVRNITFVSSIDDRTIPATAKPNVWDASASQNDGVLAYYKKVAGTSYYDVWVQGYNTSDVKSLNGSNADSKKYGVHAGPDLSYMFQNTGVTGGTLKAQMLDSAAATTFAFTFSCVAHKDI